MRSARLTKKKEIIRWQAYMFHGLAELTDRSISMLLPRLLVNSNSYYTVTLPDADGTYPVRPWCGSIESSNQVSVSGGYASPDRINCDLG